MNSDLIFTSIVQVTRGDQEGTAKVGWGIELECREWGVKSIILIVPNQTISVIWTGEDEDGNEVESYEDLELKDCETEGCFQGGEFPLIKPDELRFDPKTRKGAVWTLIF